MIDLNFPVKLIWGSEDKVVPLTFKDEIIACVKDGLQNPRLELEILEGSDHYLSKKVDSELLITTI